METSPPDNQRRREANEEGARIIESGSTGCDDVHVPSSKQSAPSDPNTRKWRESVRSATNRRLQAH